MPTWLQLQHNNKIYYFDNLLVENACLLFTINIPTMALHITMTYASRMCFAKIDYIEVQNMG